jgi:hypothetical protein
VESGGGVCVRLSFVDWQGRGGLVAAGTGAAVGGGGGDLGGASTR